MNKVIAVVVAVLALGTFSTTSAVNMKWGGDLFFNGTFGGGLRGNTVEFMGYKISIKTPSSGFGFNWFYDLTYAEIDIGLISGTLTQKGIDIDGDPMDQSDGYAAFNIGALGKYPVALSGYDNIGLWPALGIDYSFVGMEWQGKSCNSLWIKFGGGADYAWKEKMFLRAKLLYGIRMANEAENYFKDQTGGKNVLGQGLDIGVGVGWYIRAREPSKSSGGNDFD